MSCESDEGDPHQVHNIATKVGSAARHAHHSRDQGAFSNTVRAPFRQIRLGNNANNQNDILRFADLAVAFAIEPEPVREPLGADLSRRPDHPMTGGSIFGCSLEDQYVVI